MAFKKNFLIGIMDDTKVDEFNGVLSKYTSTTFEYSSFMLFSRQPLDSDNTVFDVTFFKLEAEDEDSLNRKLDEFISELNELEGDYVLGDSEKLIVTIDYVGKLFIKFDNIKFISEGTFKKIDELKHLQTEFGYTRGFKPKFRPIEGNPVGDLKLDPDSIYLISDSCENLSKLRDYISKKALKINPDFVLDFEIFHI